MKQAEIDIPRDTCYTLEQNRADLSPLVCCVKQERTGLRVLTQPLGLGQRLVGSHRSRRILLIYLLPRPYASRKVHPPSASSDEFPGKPVADRLGLSVRWHDGFHFFLGVAMVWPGWWGPADIWRFFSWKDIPELGGACSREVVRCRSDSECCWIAKSGCMHLVEERDTLPGELSPSFRRAGGELHSGSDRDHWDGGDVYVWENNLKWANKEQTGKIRVHKHRTAGRNKTAFILAIM